jgi:AcrR family transcriptional regulator
MAADNLDRRVRRTRDAIRRSFISLVLENGYDAVGVEDIAQRADIVRATFYAHYSTKDELLETLFAEVSVEVVDQIAAIEHGDLKIVRASIAARLYLHAEELRDIYLVVLRGAGQGRPRLAYIDTVAAGARRIFGRRLELAGSEPALPLEPICLAYAGAHVTLLHAWLEDPARAPAQEAAQLQTLLLTRGLGWALNIGDDFVTDLDPS